MLNEVSKPGTNHSYAIYERDPELNMEAKANLLIDGVVGPISLFPGAMVLIALPRQPKMTPALVESIHDPDTDYAKNNHDDMQLFRGTWPRITAMVVRQRSPEMIAHDIENKSPIEYVRMKHLPHYLDVERAVMLADGNLRNLENCPYFMIVAKFDVR